MSVLDLKIVRTACNDEWVARTYSEYLMHCAKSKTDFMDKINDICTDTELEALVDESEEALQPLFEQLDIAVFSGASVLDDDPSVLTRDSEDYRMFLGLAYSEPNYTDIIVPIYEQLGFDSEHYPSKDVFYNSYLKNNTMSQIIVMTPKYQTALSNKVISKMGELHYNNQSTYTMNDGFVNMYDLIKNIVMETEVTGKTGTIKLPATDSLDNSIGNIEFSLDEFWGECKTNLISTIAWAQGFASAGIDNMSDRIQSFEANISTLVNDAGSKFATSISTVKSMLADTSHSVASFIDSAEEMLGWKKLTEDNDTVINSTDVAEYTGASPLSDLNLNTAKGIAIATGRTIVAAGKAIWQGVKSLGKKIWGKVRPYVMAITNNPYDLQEINSSISSYTIDGWCYTWKDKIMYDYTNLSTATLEEYEQAITGHLNEWIKISTIFGEILYRITDYVDSISWVGTGVSHTGMAIEYEIQLKPRCMNWRSVAKYSGYDPAYAFNVFNAEVDQDTGRWDLDALMQNIEAFKNSNDLYITTNESECDCLLGFLVGKDALFMLFQYGLFDIFYDLDDNNVEHFTKYCPFSRQNYSGWLDFETELSSANEVPANSSMTVTNLDFLKAASGYCTGTSDPTFGGFYTLTGSPASSLVLTYPGGHSSHPTATCNMGPRVITAMIEIWRDKVRSPLDFVYYPYSANSTAFDNPRFKIKTDSENKNVANNLYNALAIVALVAISVLVVGSIVKIAKTKIIGKKQWKVAQMDQKMWNGQKLSFFQQLSYQRKTSKLAKLASSTAGLSAGAGVVESLSNITQQVSNTYATLNNNGVIGTLSEGNPTALTSNKNTWQMFSDIYSSITGDSASSSWMES